MSEKHRGLRQLGVAAALAGTLAIATACHNSTESKPTPKPTATSTTAHAATMARCKTGPLPNAPTVAPPVTQHYQFNYDPQTKSLQGVAQPSPKLRARLARALVEVEFDRADGSTLFGTGIALDVDGGVIIGNAHNLIGNASTPSAEINRVSLTPRAGGGVEPIKVGKRNSCYVYADQRGNLTLGGASIGSHDIFIAKPDSPIPAQDELKLASKPPNAGDVVWVDGYSFVKTAVTKQNLYGLRPIPLLTPAIEAGAPGTEFAPAVIDPAGVITHGNSGSVLVNQQGQVEGSVFDIIPDSSNAGPSIGIDISNAPNQQLVGINPQNVLMLALQAYEQ